MGVLIYCDKENVMMNVKPRINIPIILSLLLVFVFTFLLARPALSAEQADGARYDVGLSMGANLKFFKDKYVDLTLVSGKKIEGYVMDVGPNIAHINLHGAYRSKITGVNFQNVLVLIDTISTVAVKLKP